MPDDRHIDISGLNKAKVLAALWNNAAPPPAHVMPNPRNFAMTAAEAAEILLRQGAGFDYLEDRLLKVNLSDDTFDSWGYDRDNGAGLAARVIDRLRKTGSVAALSAGV
ncbi:hypothetical protein SEA_GILGAMESH_28 [Streptomyces phage Gilgamesh]|uniref:Uncharacterized protein n=1 Tax=Streptomyces phage Gilgamesh TaxID=2599890 RepID=A0A5J6TQW6_9CAUD|nr:hypothetical protein QEH35_gp028 [Streptomyces phage Gilgamesh]QFG13220.1 hypothetical protein SEA_GILGAMESH_28 [Streptomyces phage Gilgamesh]